MEKMIGRTGIGFDGVLVTARPRHHVYARSAAEHLAHTQKNGASVAEARLSSSVGISGLFDQRDARVSYVGARSARVLVIDDDPSMKHMLLNYLEQHDMRVSLASQRQDVVRQFAVGEPSVVILDLRLGQEDGLDLLREIRSCSDVPVIITTGHSDEIDRVVGLELGADDYVTKPFGVRELLARIRAVLRRRETSHIALQREAAQGRCRFGAWQLDRRARRLTNSAGEPVALTKGEYTLLLAFLDAPQRPLSREYLLQVTRVHEDVFDRSIDVQILRLRRKLEVDPSAPRIIQTERGIGYVFALPVEQV